MIEILLIGVLLFIFIYKYNKVEYYEPIVCKNLTRNECLQERNCHIHADGSCRPR